MVKHEVAMHTLSSEERRSLLELVSERYGPDLSYEAFADVMFGLFEDISGFETTSPAQAHRIVLNFWSTYHGQESRKA